MWLLLFITCKMAWDTAMHAISSDNDNQGNNYTKSSSSITATYHLNNQRDGEVERKGRILDRESLFRMPLKANPVWLPLRIPCAITRYCLLLKVKDHVKYSSSYTGLFVALFLWKVCNPNVFFTVFELISCDFSCNLLFMSACSELSVSHYVLICMLTTSS